MRALPEHLQAPANMVLIHKSSVVSWISFAAMAFQEVLQYVKFRSRFEKQLSGLLCIYCKLQIPIEKNLRKHSNLLPFPIS